MSNPAIRIGELLGCHRPVLEIQGAHARFGCIYPQEVVDRLGPFIEKDVAAWLDRLRQLTKHDWVPLEVHLQTDAGDAAEYERLFGAPVHNHAAGCWLVFDAALLDLPITPRPDFASRVRATIAGLIEGGTCCIEDVARELAVSARTLQRRLESEGTTFAEVYDETRRATAMEYLRNPRVAIKDAAFRVGFSEPSTFYRAFRRWTGATPADYRRSLEGVRASI
jgi:AraC-like DNA-binding protein